MRNFYTAKAGELAQEIVAMFPDSGSAIWELTINRARVRENMKIAGIYGRITPELVSQVMGRLPVSAPAGVDQGTMHMFPELEEAISRAPGNAVNVVCSMDANCRPIPVVPYVFRTSAGRTVAITPDGKMYSGPDNVTPEALIVFFSEMAARETLTKQMYIEAMKIIERHRDVTVTEPVTLHVTHGDVTCDNGATVLDLDAQFKDSARGSMFLAIETKTQAICHNSEQRGVKITEKSLSNRMALFSKKAAAKDYCKRQSGSWEVWNLKVN